MRVKLKDINFGDVDANAEFFAALRTQDDPLFISTFYVQDQSSIDEILSGQKYVIVGQKGTGKTAFLRYIQSEVRKQKISSDFVVFKSEVLSEVELISLHKNILFDDDKIRNLTHLQHVLKRFFLLLVLKGLTKQSKKFGQDTEDTESVSWFSSLLGRIKDASNSEIANIAMSEILAAFSSSKMVSQGDEKGNNFSFHFGKEIKSQNDILTSQIVERCKRQKFSYRLFLDEVHYAYRTEDSIKNDATLVRDIILACQSLNDRFAREHVNVVLYMGIRSEFLEHSHIAQADVHHVIESSSIELSWRTYSLNKSHPIFEIISRRISYSTSIEYSSNDIFNYMIPNTNIEEFLDHTWLKPRDAVRFFSIAKKMYSNNITLEKSQFRAVIKEYSQKAWQDVKAACSAFMPATALDALEISLRKLSPGTFDGTTNLTYDEFKSEIEKAYCITQSSGEYKYTIDKFMDMLFVVGVIWSSYKDKNNQFISYTYHRGNRNISQLGRIHVHKAIARAFS